MKQLRVYKHLRPKNHPVLGQNKLPCLALPYQEGGVWFSVCRVYSRNQTLDETGEGDQPVRKKVYQEGFVETKYVTMQN